MKKLIYLIIAICCFSKVYAVDNLKIVKHRFDNVYGVFDGVDRVHLFYAQSYSFGTELAYCIEPGIAINSEYYSSTDDLTIANLDPQILNKVRLIAYYGFAYNYGPHLNDRYYMASQEMIWKEITGRDTYWVSEENINGPRINIDREKNEISELVQNHYVLPSFDGEQITLKLGEEITLNDVNQVLGRFQLYEAYNNVVLNNNSITIKANSLTNSGEIKLINKSYTDNVSLIYYSGSSQKLMSISGILDPLIVTLKINVTPEVKLKVIKTDKLTGERIKLAGIKFKIKNLTTNEYICDNSNCIYETNSEGEFTTESSLVYGNYQIEEVSDDIVGYYTNHEPLNITIDANSNIINDEYIEVFFANQPILGQIEINKVGEEVLIQDNMITYYFDNLSGVVLGLYAGEDIYFPLEKKQYKKDDLILKIETIDGYAKIEKLPLGKYYIVEDTTLDMYVIDNSRYNIELKQDGNNEVTMTINLRNYLKKGVFKLTKVDKSTNLPLKNALINLYTDKGELIYQDVTDENGILLVSGLPLGSYYYVEEKAPDDYLVDKSKHYFELTENNQVFDANLVNEIVNVPSTNLNKSNLINIISLILFMLGGILFGFGKTL